MIHAHSLAYALLASFGYIPLGLWLDKVGRKYALPEYIIGYAIAAYAMLGSLLGRFGAYPDVPWVGVAVPMIVTGLMLFSLYRLRITPFAWAAASCLAIGFWQTLTLLHVQPEYYPAAWIGLAYAYLIAERVLSRYSSAAWIRHLKWPLGIGAGVICVLGLALSSVPTLNAFSSGKLENGVALLLAQGMAVGLTLIAARLYRSRWPMYITTWLAFFPTTLFFIGYGERLLGQDLTTGQYGLVWFGLTLTTLIAAGLLGEDR